MNKILLISLVVCVTCFGAPEQVERYAAQLRVVLQQADAAYYNSGEPIMGDAAYDALRAQYEKLRSDYPDLPSLSSVGAAIPSSASRGVHAHAVLSLKKAYDDAGIEAFLEACGGNTTYCIEPKLDGLTVVLHYREGLLVQALTRGDGKRGMDVTPAIIASGCAPTQLSNAPESLEVRGEVLLSFSAFEALNQRRVSTGLPPLKSPRSSAAGSLRLHDYAEVARRGLEIRVFEWVDADPIGCSTHTEALALMRSWGLPVIESRAVPGSGVLKAVEEMNVARAKSLFPTDGIVIRLDDRATFRQMGSTAKFPRGAMARKYRAVPVETQLLRVEWTHGKTGRLTPVAHFEPVEVDGATLQRASLHSRDHLRALDLMIGDRIQVIRAGGAVPEIIGRSPGPRTGDEQAILDYSP